MLIVLGVLLVAGGLAAVKAAQIGSLMEYGERAERQGPPPEAVGVAVAEEQVWERALTAVGTVESSRGVSLASEVAGVVADIEFASGDVAHAGQLLVALDASVERAELAGARAARELAAAQQTRAEYLHRTGATTEAQLDAARSELAQAEARVATLRAQIARKEVRAPFAGKLGIREVNLGQYLAPGTPIALLEALDVLFVDFTLPQQRIGDVAIGMPVRVEDGTTSWSGEVAAIEPAVHAVSRTVRIRAAVPNDDGALRPGMFVDVAVVLPAKDAVATVPATAIVHASYGDSIFAIEDKPADEPGMRQTPDGRTVYVARQRFVRIGEQRGDFVAVHEGVERGERIVSAGAFKLRNGAPIVVAEDAGPSPRLTPRPENR